MAEITASIAIWKMCPADIALAPNPGAPHLLRLDLGGDAHIVLEADVKNTAGQAAAMRRLAEVAGEAAERLERADFRRSLRGTGGGNG